MDDLISRQAAINLAKDIYVPIKDGIIYRHRCIDPDEIRELPSAQPNLQQTCNKLATDCISRQEAIDAVRTYLTDCQVEDADWHGDGIEHELNNLSSAQPGPRWIPCAERTPTRNDHKDGMVLVCHATGLIRFGAYIDGEWVTGEPIAWMPLPEPYEEEQDDAGAD